MKIKKRIFHLFFVLTFAPMAHAKEIKLIDLLQLVKKEKVDIELNNPIPFLNSVQLRLSGSFEDAFGDSTRRNVDTSRNRDESEQGYSESKEIKLRNRIDSWNEYKLKKALGQNQKRRKNIINGIMRGGDVKTLIELYLTLKINRKKEVYLTKLKDIQRDKVKVLKAMSQKGSADVVDYLDAVNKLESSLLDLEMQKVNLVNTVSTINSELSTDFKVYDFSTSEKLISIDFIEKILDETTYGNGLSSKLAQQEIERLEIENKLNDEQRYKVVDFIDISLGHSFAHDRSRDFGTGDRSRSDDEDITFGFQIGLNLPFLNSDMKSVSDSLDYIVKKKRAKKEFYELRDSFETLRVNLKSLVKSIKNLRSSKALSEAKKILNIYSSQKGTSPLRLLKLNEFIVSENIKQTEYELKLYTQFYEFIYETNQLSLDSGTLRIKG